MKIITTALNLSFKPIMLTLLLSIIVFSACKQEDNFPTSKNPSKVSLQVIGIKEQNLGSKLRTAQSAKGMTAQSAKAIDLTNSSDLGGFSMAVMAETGAVAPANPSAKLAKAAPVAFLNGNSSMEHGKKYRILFYQLSGGQEIYRETAEITSSSSRFEVTLVKNTPYNWYAYSYDDVQSIPLPADLQQPEIPTKTDAPLLFARGTITPTEFGNNNINIEFEHQIAKIEAKLDASEVFANYILNLSASFVQVPVTSHYFSLQNASITGNPISASNIDVPIDFVNDWSTVVKLSTNSIYTTTAFASMQIEIQQLVIDKTGQSISLIEPTSPVMAEIPGFTNDITTKKRGKIMVKYKGGIIGTLEWAEGELYYDGTDPNGQLYKISEVFTAKTEHTCNFYWNWNSLLPRPQTGTITSRPGDPCGEVLPKNTWRTPTQAEFSTLNLATAANGAISFDTNDGEKLYFHQGGRDKHSTCNVYMHGDGSYWTSAATKTLSAPTFEVKSTGGANYGSTNISKEWRKYGLLVKCVRNR